MNEMRKFMESVERLDEENNEEIFYIKFFYNKEVDPYNIGWAFLDDKLNVRGSGSDSLEDMPNVIARLMLPDPPEDAEGLPPL